MGDKKQRKSICLDTDIINNLNNNFIFTEFKEDFSSKINDTLKFYFHMENLTKLNFFSTFSLDELGSILKLLENINYSNNINPLLLVESKLFEFSFENSNSFSNELYEKLKKLSVFECYILFKIIKEIKIKNINIKDFSMNELFCMLKIKS